MGIAYNPRTITDGLVLCLDAANPKSYPGSGTTWTDLSGNGNNGTLVNGVGYSGDNLGGNISFRVPGGSTANFTATGFSGINQWGYVTCVYNQTHRQIYFNGSFVSQIAEAGVTVDFGSPQIVDPNNQIFQGNIANFKVYNRALTASEIQQNYNATKSRYI
jgi:hypothetical protein